MSTFGARFGALIKFKRGIEGLTQEQLAGMAFDAEQLKTRISELENGKVPNPQQKTIDALVVALNISPEELAECRNPPDAPTLPPDLLENLSQRFGHDNPDAPPEELAQYLKDKAKDYKALQSQLDALKETDKRIENLVGAAKGALSQGHFEKAQSLYAGAREIQRRERTEPALKQEQALYWAEAESHLFNDNATKAAESFDEGAKVLASLGKDDVGYARQEAAEKLYEHGRRYGGDGLEAAIMLWQKNLKTWTKTAEPENWAMTQNNLALALQNEGTRAGGETGVAGLEEAVTAYRQALVVYTREAHPVNWAVTQNNLANALQVQGTRAGGETGVSLQKEAVTAYRYALGVYTREAHPVQWAMSQMNLANALQAHGTRAGGETGVALLEESVTAYRKALEVRTREAHPADWAMTQNNLAIALQEQGTRAGGETGVALLEEAVTAYRQALEVRTREAHPVGWAMTQMNLATALDDQGTRAGGETGVALLEEAVAAYRQALEVYTREAHPVNSARTQMNLANALQARGTGAGGETGVALLKEAVTAYRQALEVRTREAHPVDWAMTQGNLANAFDALGDLSEGDGQAHYQTALDHANAALEIMTAEHLPQYHQMATHTRDRIKAKFDALPNP